MQLIYALFGLAFATARLNRLTLLHTITSRLIMQKARGCTVQANPDIVLPLLVNIRFQVLFHSPSRSSFHLSLTVLVHYRSLSSV
jgi:hypothetical protein